MRIEPNQLSFCLGLLLVACGGFHASAAEENREADHAALRVLRDKIAAAIEKQDIKTLASCFAKEFAFTAVNQTVVTNESQMEELFDRMFRSPGAPIISMKTEPKADILTRFLDANTGVCYGSSKDTYTLKGGQTVEMKVRWSATVLKEDGDWKVALAHAGTDFLDNPVLEGVKGLIWKIGIGAGVGGVLLGFIAGRTVKSRMKAG